MTRATTFWGRFAEFFEDSDGRMSMSRLLMFLSFWPSSFVVCITAWRASPSIGEVLAIYVGGFVLGYVGGKWAEPSRKRSDDCTETAATQ